MPRLSRWWEKGKTTNMIEVHSAQELIDSLVTAGDKLVVLDFYSPGCGACRSVHPKVCQKIESFQFVICSVKTSNFEVNIYLYLLIIPFNVFHSNSLRMDSTMR